MKIKLVTLSTETEHEGWLKFKQSLDYFGYDYHLIHQQSTSGAHVWGTQMPILYQYLKELREKGEYTHVIYADAWDSLALGGMTEIVNKVPRLDIDFLGSVEKACFPHPELASQYPETPYDWKYINGGGWLASIDYFIKMYEESPSVGINDQLWLTERYLANKGERVLLDTDCKIFQTVGFEHEDDFTYQHGTPGRLLNNVTNEKPVILHGNGRTDMTKHYELFKLDL